MLSRFVKRTNFHQPPIFPTKAFSHFPQIKNKNIMVVIRFIIDSAQTECKRQGKLCVKVGIKVFHVQNAATCTL